jgi:hypothetical protein
VHIYFNSELVNVDKDGDLLICVDANADAPYWKWGETLPSYQFYKRKDESVYYSISR